LLVLLDLRLGLRFGFFRNLIVFQLFLELVDLLPDELLMKSFLLNLSGEVGKRIKGTSMCTSFRAKSCCALAAEILIALQLILKSNGGNELILAYDLTSSGH